jgi:hypothetical protein
MRVIENKKAHLPASFLIKILITKFIPAGDTNFILCALCFILYPNSSFKFTVLKNT